MEVLHIYRPSRVYLRSTQELRQAGAEDLVEGLEVHPRMGGVDHRQREAVGG